MSFLETTVGLIILRCDNYLENRGVKGGLLGFPPLQSVVTRITDDDLKQWVEADPNKKAKNKKKADPQEVRYLTLLEMLGGGTVMQSLLDLSIALFSYPEFGAYLTTYFGYSVNLHLAFLLENIEFPTEDEIQKAAEGARTLMYVNKKQSPLQYSELTLDERSYGYLFGSDDMNALLEGATTRFFHAKDGKKLNDVYVNEDILDQAVSFFEKKGRTLQLSGKGGRRFLTKKLACELKKDFLFVNLPEFLSECGRERIDEYIEALIREARFDEAGICFYGISEGFIKGPAEAGSGSLTRDLEMLEYMAFRPVMDAGIPVVMCTDATRQLLSEPDMGEYLLLELPITIGYDERKILWEKFAGFYKLSLDAESFAMRYNLNASEISRLVKGFLERSPGTKEIGDKETALFTKICMQRAEREVAGGVGRIIYPDIRLDDVKLKPENRAVIDDVITSIKKSGVILDEWGLRKSYPYGRSISLLLAGPPGTGKTMTANAISGELGLPLYQVNLSNVVDKYIGETEKNLEKAFAFAEKSDVVLFFDEADALFGTRSEVHDSKDRYANTQVSYLLQRMESYDGVVIMATNIKTNIDSAFMRRIRYALHYENPDEELRRQIWESCLTDKIPHEDIDFDYLASQFKTFTGSVIKTVFLNACACAADRGEKLSMVHLVHALRHELQKSSAVAFTIEALGKYGYCF